MNRRDKGDASAEGAGPGDEAAAELRSPPTGSDVNSVAMGKREPVAERPGRPSSAPGVQRAYDLLIWLIPAVDRMPRSRRFTRGDRIESAALDLLESLTDAAYQRDRSDSLAGANRSLQRLRLLVRASKDLRVLDLRRYEHAAGPHPSIEDSEAGSADFGRGQT